MSLAAKLVVASLLALPLAACSSSPSRTSAGAVGGGNVVTMKVDGMAGANCAKHIEHELAEAPGVRTATVSFETKTATVTLDPERPASTKQLDAAVAAWRKEHFAQEEDAECLDPQRREQIKKGM